MPKFTKVFEQDESPLREQEEEIKEVRKATSISSSSVSGRNQTPDSNRNFGQSASKSLGHQNFEAAAFSVKFETKKKEKENLGNT